VDLPTFLRRVAANIKKARWAAGLTQEEAAAEVLSFRYYQEVERGERNPSVGTLFSLARRLGVTAAALVEVDVAATDRARARMKEAPARPPRRGRRPSLATARRRKRS
jgi:transcriptional regulator with XRE-family HTH domain